MSLLKMQEVATELSVVSRVRAERDFLDFVRQAWHVVEPGAPFVPGKHIEAIAEHLEAIAAGDIRKLLINIPPRSAKSLLCSVFFPAWMWVTRPARRFLTSSYAMELSTRDAVKTRRLLGSQWFLERWGGVFSFTGDQNRKTRYENDKSGHRIASSVGAAATGEGGDILIVDDPHSALDTFSQDKMRTAVSWFDEVWSTRQNDPKTSCQIVIMQRLSESDLSQHIVDQGGWDHLMIPMRYDEKRVISTTLGWEDWREKDGELMWPERIDDDAVNDMEKRLGGFGAAGQLQQSPIPRGGGMFKREWFRVVDVCPQTTQAVRYWDRAGSLDGDWTAGVKMAKLEDGRFCVVDVIRFKGTASAVENAIRNAASQDGAEVPQVLEEDPGQAGKKEIEYLTRALAGCNLKAVRVSKNKEVRASPLSSQAEAGNLLVLKGGWNTDYIDEMASFPRGKYDDQVDGTSGAFGELVTGNPLWIG